MAIILFFFSYTHTLFYERKIPNDTFKANLVKNITTDSLDHLKFKSFTAKLVFFLGFYQQQNNIKNHLFHCSWNPNEITIFNVSDRTDQHIYMIILELRINLDLEMDIFIRMTLFFLRAERSLCRGHLEQTFISGIHSALLYYYSKLV